MRTTPHRSRFPRSRAEPRIPSRDTHRADTDLADVRADNSADSSIDHSGADAHRIPRATAVLRPFLKLGLSAFGGPIAHLAYFRAEFVVARGWLSEEQFADTVALCQFLPGPTSSQVGFVIAFERAGLAGALLAWSAFTLPSALLMFAFAQLATLGAVNASLVHALKLVAVAVVADALWKMMRTLTPDVKRAGIAVAVLGFLLAVRAGWAETACIAAGALVGALVLRRAPGATVREAVTAATAPTAASASAFVAAPAGSRVPDREPHRVPRVMAIVSACACVALLVASSYVTASTNSAMRAVPAAMYRAGALVFGGGHVVLPLLHDVLVRPGWVGESSFLAGYGAAQALPGPLFSVAAYFGAVANPTHAVRGAALALVGIFLPGLLIVVAALPAWRRLSASAIARGATQGAGAAVVGVLAAAFCALIVPSAMAGVPDVVIVAVGIALLALVRWPAWAVAVVVASLVWVR